ncbi:L,D-transpeptidase family protein [Ahrensia marina]|jgi:murein L,D-transpeptidase YcbB/YkuD|uniref:L,D-transpeptidase family protein n=1 Tax=Ahrensia marina TaxID=1514904 RepID=UPI0035CF28DA
MDRKTNHLKTRRQILAAGLGLGASALAMRAAHAQQSALDALLDQRLRQHNSGWGDSFDSTAQGQAPVISPEPMFSPASAVNLETALRQHSDMMNRGGWNQVPADSVLRLGVRHPNVQHLRQRLIVGGDLAQQWGISDIFDSYVDSAVKRFQARHGLVVDGIMGPEGFAAMNVPIGFRVRQMETNLVRIRSMSGFLGDRYVMVNIPAAALEAINSGRVTTRHTAIVGKVDRPTPILDSRIHELNFNPYWTVPVSIIRRDLIPLMQENPSYLAENNIRIFNSWGASAQELAPEQVNWNTEEATRYMFRQDPGEINSLGSVKINFHNEHQVYLHDTPDKSLFGDDYRFLSSGCVRVQNIRELVTWLLANTDGWSRQRIDQVIQTGERVDLRIPDPAPLYINYVTAWAASDGTVNFREDIYNRDGLPTVASNG